MGDKGQCAEIGRGVVAKQIRGRIVAAIFGIAERNRIRLRKRMIAAIVDLILFQLVRVLRNEIVRLCESHLVGVVFGKGVSASNALAVGADTISGNNVAGKLRANKTRSAHSRRKRIKKSESHCHSHHASLRNRRLVELPSGTVSSTGSMPVMRCTPS